MHDTDSFHHIAQFTHIARPVITHQQIQSIARDLANVFAEFLTVVFEKKLKQWRNILTTITKRRDMDWEHVETIKKIFTKRLLLDCVLEFKIGGSHNSDIDIDIPVTPQPANFTILEDPEQLDLKVRIHLTNFIKKNRTAVGLLKETYLTVFGIGKSASFMSKEFGFK